MSDVKDLQLLLKANTPIIVIESSEETRVIDMLQRSVVGINKPLYSWTITRGLQRQDIDMGHVDELLDATDVLKHIVSDPLACLYVLLDFHPYLSEPVNVRLIKELALEQKADIHQLILVSHDIDIPDELHPFCAYFELRLPNQQQLMDIIKEEAGQWSQHNQKQKVQTDNKTLKALVSNLNGLSFNDARRLVKKAIVDDGAISVSDMPKVMKAKYELLNQDSLLAYEFETEDFANVGGMQNLKQWLKVRKTVFVDTHGDHGLPAPKGILLLGVQGCGKSLVSRAVAGIFSVPLLRLDFGSLYNKFFGESEKNLNQALATATVMAPCVLWIDEIEKGLSVGDNDGGTSRRVLASLLTWMSENKNAVFIVATANDIEKLPPELIRKGRFDEIFFVDLPDANERKDIFRIHLKKRNLKVKNFDMTALSEASEGFSGSEIEQAIVSALYMAHATAQAPDTQSVMNELRATRPLSVVMSEKINYLRDWAKGRTVSVQ
jgi:SpoVK/Ycf46/Vps4 family AAA+-type ATPase